MHNLSVSFAELAADFELYSGLWLEDPRYGRDTPWARRAEYMRLMFNAIFKYSQGYAQAFRQGRFPRTRSRPLATFGIGQKLQGFEVRPRFVMAQATDTWIATNASRQALVSATISRSSKGKLRDGQLNLSPTYINLVVPPRYRPPEVTGVSVQIPETNGRNKCK